MPKPTDSQLKCSILLKSSFYPILFPQNTDGEKECFNLLCRAYIEARYNKDYKITSEQLEYLIARVEILKDMTERLCKEKIAEYNAMAENG